MLGMYYSSSTDDHKMVANGMRGRHYVAFIRKHIPDENEEAWVLFNDEKVVKAVDVEEMKKFAYVYFFQRVEM